VDAKTRIPLLILLLLATPVYPQDGERWWSLRRLEGPPVPEVSGDWGRNELDAFVLARLEAAGIAPSGEADRRTLIRRATFDLHGLPPTPAEVDAFLSDDQPRAFERLVERLLASPRYGERWARHWLDVAHYGDTHGFDKDKVRPHSWPYRDWVIRALNEDVGWARFVEMQVAGDVLFPHDPDGVVATGFVAAGPWDFVGHVELREGTVDKAITRNLDRDDMVATTMSAFTSVTVHCARCHDHKFDPISQESYYALQAVFAGIERADRPYEPAPVMSRRRGLEARREELRDDLARLAPESLETPEVRRLVAAGEAAGEELAESPPLPLPSSPSNGWHSAIMSGPAHQKWVEVDLGRAVVLDEVVLWPARPVDFADTPGFGFPSRYEVAVSSDAGFSDPRVLTAHVDADAENPGDEPVRVRSDGSPVRVIRVTGHRLWKRYEDWVMALSELQAMAAGQNLAAGAEVRSRDSIESGRWSRRHLVDGFTSRDRIGAERPGVMRRRALEAAVRRMDRELASERQRAERELYPERVKAREVRAGELREVEARLAILPEPRLVYAAASDFRSEGNFKPPPGGRPREIRLLERGDVKSPGALVVPAALDCVDGVSADLGPDLEQEGARRAALARWITSRDNPLTWRSAVNRVWQHHFARGIAASPNDFGEMGARPSHPALLDWLAVRFRDGGGSLKDLHRVILNSATWRQASVGDPVRAAVDGGNRLLWRSPVRRLDAESLRDAVLAVAGTLDLTMGGPGFRTFGFKDDHSPHYLYEDYKPDDRATWRRAIYRFQVRSVPDPFMETLDCADSSRSTPVRSETVTALQALALLNNRFMMEQAGHMAARVERHGGTLQERVTWAFALAVGRAPAAEESEPMTGYAARYGVPALCRLLFNLNEFLFID